MSSESCKERDLIPATAKEALERWDAGEFVFTVEMGGLGPSYEQCIHIVTFELIRDFLSDPERMAKEEEGKKTFNYAAISPTIVRVESEKHLGLSGAQVGEAQWLAYRYLTQGYAASIATAPEDRKIQVSKTFPG